ncbi:hemolysin family protein [Gracilibacillus sp. YIM 98692]|uniref:hemolysin family protein n=1 Tax=Gracilibacillus sp. YIM 98692 TaxID=2663532 RepID=UPI0013D68760|nr:hemolysin family protein [Gracilibacillus sp. YIM 98692]
MITIKLLTVALLIILTAFFVASEFAVVKVRKTRIDALAEEGNKKAKAGQKVLSNLDGYLSACQLGITLTALGLGWLGEPTIERILLPLFHTWHIPESVSHILSFSIAFATITFLHVVIGELAPKTVAIQKAKQLTLWLSPPLILFYKIMYPFIWALNGSARYFVGLFGIKPASEHEVAHSEEELRTILAESYRSGEINQAELNYVNKIFKFDNRIAKEIMIPRTEMATLSRDDSIDEVLSKIKKQAFTRYPVENGDKDHIKGIVNVKELYASIADLTPSELRDIQLKDFITPVTKIIETTPIHDLLLKMQEDRKHLIILIDEYGGTAGLVTIEDILEEIVGEIRDEFDHKEKVPIQQKGEGHYIVDGKVLLSEINHLLDIDLDATDIDTIGGWMHTQNFDLDMDRKILQDDVEFTILETDGQVIKTVEIVKKNKEQS